MNLNDPTGVEGNSVVSDSDNEENEDQLMMGPNYFGPRGFPQIIPHKPSPAPVVISAKLKSRVRRLGNCTRILGGVSANDFWQTVKTIEFFNGSKGGPDANKTETFVSRNGDQTTLREAVRYSVADTLTDKSGTSLPYVVSLLSQTGSESVFWTD